MIRLDSIEEVSKRFETSGSRPLLVHASDMEDYVCKYPFYPNDSKLLNEFLAFHFARLWNIRIPDLALVQVRQEHLPQDMLGMGLSYISIQKPLVGSHQITDVVEIIDKTTVGFSDSDLKKFNKIEFLKIALFDIWLSNEDRNCGNMNLLINQQEEVISPIAIDHEKIFNSRSPLRRIELITYEDSLFYSNLFHRLFRSQKGKNLRLFEEIGASLQPYTSRCQRDLQWIIDSLPEEWGFDKNEIYRSLIDGIFSEGWISEVGKAYKEFITLMTQNP